MSKITARTIATARAYLAAGSPDAYARVMSAAIRSAMSKRVADDFRSALIEDNAQHAFINLDTHCPLAR